MLRQATHKQLVYLFLSNFTILFVGMGLFPLLPVYFSRFGAQPGMTGVFFAAIYLANAAGPMMVGWLSGRISQRVMFVTAGLLGVPALLLLGHVQALWQVVALTALLWFCGGMDIALVSVFTGLHTQGKNRGKSFSLVSLSIPLGSLLGGATIGYLVNEFGFSLMFTVLGIFWMALPVLGIFAIKDTQQKSATPSVNKISKSPAGLGARFSLLLLIALLSSIAINMGRLGNSLSMQNLQYSASSIASSATISGLIAIPLTLLIGILSDRLGHRHFLAMTCLLAAGAAVSLGFASGLWQFWLVATLVLVAFCINGAMLSALATNLLPAPQMGRGLSLVNTASSTGSILSFMTTGYLLEWLGQRNLFLMAAILPILAALMLELMLHNRETPTPVVNLSETDCLSQPCN
jgi:MFS family permease